MSYGREAVKAQRLSLGRTRSLHQAGDLQKTVQKSRDKLKPQGDCSSTCAEL